MRGRSVAALVTLAMFTLPAGRARAEDASNQAAAQALFEQARQLIADGKFGEACPKLAESERLDPGAGTLLNLGHCYEKNGQTASAWVTFKDAAAAADLKHRADWSQRARERAQALEAVISKLTIDVPAAARVSGLQVRRDGVEVGSAVWGTPIPTDPGEHVIEAAAPAKKTWTMKVTVGPKSDQAQALVPTLEDEPAPSAIATPQPAVSPPPVASPPPTAPPPESSPGGTQRVVGGVIGGVGIAGIVAGSVIGGLALGKESSSKNLCPGSSTCTNGAGVDDNNTAKNLATPSTVAMIAGGAFLVAGVVIYFTAPKGNSGSAIALTPAVGAGELGLRLGGAW